MKIIAITQARVSSSRLPEKVLLKLGSGTVLDLHLKRIKKSKMLHKTIVASTFEDKSVEIKKVTEKNGCAFFQGDTEDVLGRFYNAAKNENPDFIVRLTSDCPLIDPELIDDLINKFIDAKVDYASNCLNATLPDGMDAEIFTFKSLEVANKEAQLKSDREHVTPYIRNSGKFKIHAIDYQPNLGNYRLTLDTREDYILIQKLVDSVGEDASMHDYVDYLKRNPELIDINSQHKRNEGYLQSLKSDGQFPKK